ncbi:hypothetical protein Tco_0760031 [Tanacetum coccineum]
MRNVKSISNKDLFHSNSFLYLFAIFSFLDSLDHGVGISNSLSESDKHTSLGEQVIIPSPAGIVRTAKLCKLADTQKGGEESVMSTQEYIKKVIEDVGEDDDFTRALWLSMLDYGTVNEVIKSCTSNALGDLTIRLKDLSGTISGTIHYKVLTAERYAKVITIGAALILHNVSVFSPKQSTHHYLNITKKNMVKVFHKDGGSA